MAKKRITVRLVKKALDLRLDGLGFAVLENVESAVNCYDKALEILEKYRQSHTVLRIVQDVKKCKENVLYQKYYDEK